MVRSSVLVSFTVQLIFRGQTAVRVKVVLLTVIFPASAQGIFKKKKKFD